MPSRPTGVLVIAVYYFLNGAATFAVTIWLLMFSADATRIPFVGIDIAKYLLLIALVTACIGAGYAAIGWGLTQLRQWAQAAAIMVAGLSLLSDVALIVLLSSAGALVPAQWYLIIVVYALISVAIVGYLLTPNVAAIFGAPARARAESSCPHCSQPGIREGMTVCPYCKQSLFSTLQPNELPMYGHSAGPQDNVLYGQTLPAASLPSVVTMSAVPSKAAGLGWLVVKAGPDTGKRLDLSDDNAIGRDVQCQIMLSDDHMSRQHARVKFEAGQFFIYDIGSSSGTFVNGRQVQRLMLYDGAVIRLGNTTMEFKKTTSAN
jgi:hypothetical protein